MTLLKSKFITQICAFVCSASIFAANAQILPSPPQVNAKGYFLVDFTTGKVIAEGEADTKLAPASLTKMMTSYVIGTEINAGNISPSDMVTISEKAWAKNFPESSKMFIEVGKQVSVDDLNRGIIIQSGNDACVAMAEHIAGSESAFADLMNAHAEKLGMTNSHFINSHGLDTEEHYTTPRDMATLGAALIRDVPDEYALYKEKSFTFNGIKQYNRNTLLWDASLDVDGIKTGHTSEAGYSLVTSATKDDMRLIAVVMGTASERARKVESKKLLNYGFRFFETITPYKAGDSFAEQRIWMGNKETVSLGILQDTPITIPRGQRKNLKANFELDKTLEAPLAKGSKVGTLFLQLEGEEIAQYPLVTLEEIGEGSFFSKIYDYLRLQIAQ
ncbi:D-alanyl-D-alanine carboxypeptidase [Pseudoalteromonas sp. JBTF-M23]|uniref:serine-type D-Ala-D-Ala carboxypeptidase n=1 Tax=Pseudoalteromonas caenipelagi TaxID=2726988 RepID=A0A849VFQ9_9GAMM|nr:serine hydrolase [Pseudoalteromonas caenipelagi]NOU52559.1 D-alanyl-D-alanine carboxypeptidase [Pseudoalteromonas caenipelagi]